jgi:hypothetical protein
MLMSTMPPVTRRADKLVAIAYVDMDGSYVYGPNQTFLEQINNSTGTVLYLHHDQQGSTRLLTGSTGVKEASFTYDSYDNQTGHTGTATTPLGPGSRTARTSRAQYPPRCGAGGANGGGSRGIASSDARQRRLGR